MKNEYKIKNNKKILFVVKICPFFIYLLYSYLQTFVTGQTSLAHKHIAFCFLCTKHKFSVVIIIVIFLIIAFWPALSPVTHFAPP
jgi:hypothetical protein